MSIRHCPILLLCVVTMLLIGAPSFVSAQGAFTGMPITMFIPDTDWPPYLITNENQTERGVLIDVFREAIRPMGCCLTVQRLPNKRGWEMLENGAVDVHAKAKKWVPNPERFLWSNPFMKHEGVLISRSVKPLRFTTPDRLFNKRVATITGFIYPRLEPFFRSRQIHRVDSASPRAMLELVNRGRVDAALVNFKETLWFFKNNDEIDHRRFHLDTTPYDTAQYRFVFTKDDKWKPIIKRLNQELEAMRRDGRLKRILNQYR